MSGTRHWGQYFDQRSPVSRTCKSVIEDSHDSAVFVRSDEPPHSLREGRGCDWKINDVERCPTTDCFSSGFQKRIIGTGKRKLVKDDERQGATR